MVDVKQIFAQANEEEILKVVFSQPIQSEYVRVECKKLKKGYQFERKTNTQVFHQNITSEQLIEMLVSEFEQYKQCHCFTSTSEVSMRKSKKGKLQYSRKQMQIQTMQEHNRKKNYLLPEGEIIEPLVDMGIFSKDGKIIASMQDKYRQINKFLEIIDDGIKKLDQKTVRIVDFGCGKSYLTFIVYYYLRLVKKVDVHMVGLDLKTEVIKNCNEAAKRYGYDQLSFEVGNIEGYQSEQQIDVVLSLHACDTATDYALFHAISWNASLIFSVPCCQHELNAQIKSDEFSIITRYGIAQERMSALFTDIIRCNLVQACGYKTQLLEFVDLAHTPKNMLIRARKTHIPDHVKKQMLQEVDALMKTYQLKPTLYQLLYPTKQS